MPPEDIPEDMEESYPCPNCAEGSITRDPNQKGIWLCDKCPWVPTETQIKSWYGPCGSLICDGEIKGITNTQASRASEEFYGSPFFIGETMTEKTAEILSKALNLNYQGSK